MPPYHPILGHLPQAINLAGNLPRDSHAHYLPHQIRRRYPDLGPTYYLDVWPFAEPFLIVTSPTMVAQFSQQDSPLPKHPGIRKFMQPVTGGHDLVSMEGQTWKIWRKTFNPAFSANHMMTLVPSMMEEVMVFRDILREHAEKQAMFSLDEATINATMDVIGKVAL
jgi:cytochrome P450